MNSLTDVLNLAFSKGPVISSSNCSTIGNSLIVAPHPDDESLACGGTIALLRNAGFAVHVVFTTNGTMSHPNSKIYRAHKLLLLREAEAVKALSRLGVASNMIRFLRLPDSKLDNLEVSESNRAIGILKELLLEFKPKTVFLPWRNDPHPDHMASFKFAQASVDSLRDQGFQFRILEYPVWFWERTQVSEFSKEKSMALWKVNIETNLDLKRSAIAEHASQLGKVIMDDPTGFVLSEAMLDHFSNEEEVFFEYLNEF